MKGAQHRTPDLERRPCPPEDDAQVVHGLPVVLLGEDTPANLGKPHRK